MRNGIRIKRRYLNNNKSFTACIRSQICHRYLSKPINFIHMNFKNIKRISLIAFIFASSGSFAQYKYDIGLRASSYDMERFQLEQRFHLDSPYSIVVTFASGSRGDGSYSQTPIYNDSLITISHFNYTIQNNALKVGVQRKLSFLAGDVYYAGATLGIGYERGQNRLNSTTYSVGDSVVDPYPYMYNWDEINSTNVQKSTKAINAQLGLSFGMDVPISKRLSINAELGFSGILTNSLTHDYSTIELLGSVSGGLRYQFGEIAQ